MPNVKPFPEVSGDARPAFIRTSERALFRRCRRLWAWQSPNRFNLTPADSPDYFWFGTGVHYALEDFHGYNRYGSPDRAFKAYVIATEAARKAPPTVRELEILGIGLMQYYSQYWLKNRHALQTYWHNGEPQCEVNFHIELPVKTHDGRAIYYRGTIDRVAIDEYDRLWVVEYKTAKAFRIHHFDTDNQITSYCWAASALYDLPVAGVVYMQFKKDLPEMPRILASGRVSTDKKQNTTAKQYRQALLDIYGDISRAPPDNVALLNSLVAEETEDADRYIRRDYLERSPAQIQSEGTKILLEVEDIFNPNIALYPNPTGDCGWQCALQSVCVAMDDGSDFENLLESLTVQRKEEDTSWRQLLPLANQVPQLPPFGALPQAGTPQLEPPQDFLAEWL